MSRFRGLNPTLIPAAEWLFNAALAAGLRPRVTSVFRTRQQQAVLYDRYLRGMSLLPAAPPGKSLHEKGLAFDMVTEDPSTVGATWKALGGQWYACRDVGAVTGDQRDRT